MLGTLVYGSQLALYTIDWLVLRVFARFAQLASVKTLAIAAKQPKKGVLGAQTTLVARAGQPKITYICLGRQQQQTATPKATYLLL
jgi:hypothetical protein